MVQLSVCLPFYCSSGFGAEFCSQLSTDQVPGGRAVLLNLWENNSEQIKLNSAFYFFFFCCQNAEIIVFFFFVPAVGVKRQVPRQKAEFLME